jgi:hypothetical protein
VAQSVDCAAPPAPGPYSELALPGWTLETMIVPEVGPTLDEAGAEGRRSIRDPRGINMTRLPPVLTERVSASYPSDNVASLWAMIGSVTIGRIWG